MSLSPRTIEAFTPTVETDGGPWATHNMPCPVLGPPHHAVLDIGTGIFHPSWKAQEQGWRLVLHRPWWKRITDAGRAALREKEEQS